MTDRSIRTALGTVLIKGVAEDVMQCLEKPKSPRILNKHVQNCIGEFQEDVLSDDENTIAKEGIVTKTNIRERLIANYCEQWMKEFKYHRIEVWVEHYNDNHQFKRIDEDAFINAVTEDDTWDEIEYEAKEAFTALLGLVPINSKSMQKAKSLLWNRNMPHINQLLEEIVDDD